jgi:ferrous iron transport protein B
LDAVLLHPVWGLPIFALMMLVLFQAVFWIGGGIQSVLADGFEALASAVIVPATASLPAWLSGLLVDAIYEGIATLISFVPLVGLFFFLMAVLSESGYLARMAFLTDGLMAKFGLEGRSLVLTVMGMGCNVPAVLGARVIGNTSMRLLTQLTLPFALCSARFQVFVFIAAALFASWQAALVVMGLYVLSIAATLLTAWIGQKALSKGVYEPVIFEMPAYRVPNVWMAFRSSGYEVLDFLRRASWLIVLGVVLVWGLLNFPSDQAIGHDASYAAQIGHFLSPLFDPMGLPELYVVALLFGLVAKEVVLGGLMVLLGIASDLVNREDALSAAVSSSLPVDSALALMAFVLLYTPCLATLAVLRQEGGWRLMLVSLGWSFVFAWCVAVVVYMVSGLLK